MKRQSSWLAAVVLSLSVNAWAEQQSQPAVTPDPRPTGDNWIEPRPAVETSVAGSKSSSNGSTAATPRPQQPAAQPQTQKFAAPEGVQKSAAAPKTPSGQWVYTQQYGWVWLPYARQYTTVGDEGYPYSYVYYPTYGWRWVYSPWVFGWGPTPYYGVYGRARFGWYVYPWHPRAGLRGGPIYRGAPVYRGGYYRGWHAAPGYRGGYHGGGFRGGYHGGYHGGGFRGGGRGRR